MAVDDQLAVEMADLVYTAITTTADAAGAVHAATREMRDSWPARPSVWASHIHVGP